MGGTTLQLPARGGALESYELSGTPIAPTPGGRKRNRIAFAAAHVVANSLSDQDPTGRPDIDWDRTVAFRHHLLDLGFGIAEAMDTAQRGMGLDWPGARELIARTLEATRGRGDALIFSGCGTEQLDPAEARGLDDVVAAYCEQMEAIQKLGGRVTVMASRALARVAVRPQDYAEVYKGVLAAAEQPVILHWLGEMFDPALQGYWGADAFEETMETCLAVIEESAAKVDGIKISLLDDRKEVDMRRRLPAGVKMYTGDDFNYPELIAGDEEGYSHALLGIFDPIAPAAAEALDALAEGDRDTYDRVFAPTVPLSRLIFRAPTPYYKTGVVFMAWLNGFQDHFVMIGGQQSARPLSYFAEVFRLADRAGLLRDPDEAVVRMKRLLAVYGVGV